MKVRMVALWGVCLVALSSVLGCGEGYDGPKLYPLTGKITVNGQPPGEQFKVMLQPADPSSPGPNLLVQDDGSYEARSGMKGWEGAPAGKYKVIVQALQSGEAAYQQGATGVAKLPPELAAYATAETSPKEIEVTAGDNQVDITIP